jgi:hypothetical protein
MWPIQRDSLTFFLMESIGCVSNCWELHARHRLLTVEREEYLEIAERGNWRSYVQKSVQNQCRHHGAETRKRKCHVKCPICHLKFSCRLGTLENGHSHRKTRERLSLFLLISHMTKSGTWVQRKGGKWPGKWAAFALKHEHLPPILSNIALVSLRNRSRGRLLCIVSYRFCQFE